MKFSKSLAAFIFPLIMMLSSFSVYLLVNKLVNNYKENVSIDYSIIVVSSEPIVSLNTLTPVNYKRIDKIDRDDIINDIKDSLSDLSFQMLNTQLPYFYELYLNEFPTNEELERIKSSLLELKMIKEVEVFETDHNNLYSLLVLTKDIVTVLFIVVLFSSFLMLLQQIRILLYEHSERISILQLLGASLFYSTKSIVGMIIISVIVSVLVTFILIFLLTTNVSLISQSELLGIMPTVHDLYFELAQIAILAICIPLVAFVSLLIKHRINNDV